VPQKSLGTVLNSNFANGGFLVARGARARRGMRTPGRVAVRSAFPLVIDWPTMGPKGLNAHVHLVWGVWGRAHEAEMIWQVDYTSIQRASLVVLSGVASSTLVC